MNIFKICFFAFWLALGLLVCGCQGPRSYERSVSLVPAADGDPNTVVEPADPLDVLATVEKIVGDSGLKVYHADKAEADLLEMADADLLGGSGGPTNVTEYKHPELPVYLTVTRTPEEILLLLNYTPEADGTFNPEAEKLYGVIQSQLETMLSALEVSPVLNAKQ